MSSVLYSIFIYPIELFIRLVLETSFNLVNSYGLALIAVSVVVSVVLLPVYSIAEKLQQKERAVRAAMAKNIEDIKQAYKGYERHLYLKALYREYEYHPLSSLKSSLGLIIQLPFLIAAYNLISRYGPLQGVSFTVISDLSRPDGLLSIAGMRVNLLPLIMTVVNLGGAYFYAKGLSRRDGLQMVFVALVFLGILYTAPSGVLLYWTCNNIFIFGKYLFLYVKR